MILPMTEHSVVGPWCVCDVQHCFKNGAVSALRWVREAGPGSGPLRAGMLRAWTVLRLQVLTMLIAIPSLQRLWEGV